MVPNKEVKLQRNMIRSRSILHKLSSPFLPRFISTETELLIRKLQAKNHKSAKKKSEPTVFDILNEHQNQGNVLDSSVVVNLVDYFRKRKNYKSALQLYDWVESNKLTLNGSDHVIRIDLLFKSKGLAAAEEYFNSLRSSEKSDETRGAILSCFCKGKVLDKARAIFNEMKDLNCVSLFNYKDMLSLYLSIEKHEDVPYLVQNMKDRNIAPDLYTYNLLISSFAAMKLLGDVESVVERMKIKNVECDLSTYGKLATIFFKSGSHEKAKSYLDMMEKMETQTYKEVYECFRVRVKLYSEMNDLPGVIRAWESLGVTKSKIDNNIYIFMLMALSKLGSLECLEKLYQEWDEFCGNYDFSLPNVLLEFYLDKDMIENVTTLYKNLLSRGTGPSLRALNLFIILCFKTQNIDLAMKYLVTGIEKAKLQNQTWFPTDEAIELFLDFFGKKKDMDGSQKFIESMEKINRVDSNILRFLLEQKIIASDVVVLPACEIFEFPETQLMYHSDDLLDFVFRNK